MSIKVLIVDDEMDTCRMLSLGLKVAGLQTDFALSGEQALTKAQSYQPSAVVCDLMMPDLDGYEVTRRLRANPATAKVPIFILSATADPKAEQHCLTAGATGFIRKPVLLRELADKIKKALE
ncbi:MAG TPA: response regulator [Anaerolineales bacterium]|nr:response regulator [Anaerolineales bacterium]